MPDSLSSSSSFVPALLVIDCQVDFVTGSLAVKDGVNIFPYVNKLLSLPAFEGRRVATKDWHPQNHVSFAENHPPPDNVPFESNTTIINPFNSSETYSTRLWPVHCVQNSPGAELVPELDAEKLDAVINKGTDPRVEMYSAFKDPFEYPTVSDSGLEKTLKDRGVTDVYVVGLALDYCVFWSASHARKANFPNVYVIREATKAVDPEKDAETIKELERSGVKVVNMDSEEVKRVLDHTG